MKAAVHVPRAVRRTVAALGLLAASASALVAVPETAHAFPAPMRLPFATGQAWYVCQGYNGSITHGGSPDLDLTTYSQRGSNGCWGGENAAANQPVVAPGAGQLANLNNGLGGVCITFDSGGSMYFGHLTSRRASGRVTTGTVIGKVAPAGTEGNGGYAHLHLSARSGSGCGGTKIPFDTAHGAKFLGAPNMTYSGAANQWAGTRLVALGTRSCDINGDGRADLIAYRPSDRTWRIDWNRDGTTDFARAYGAANADIPAPGDYNGDGKSDLGVYRPSDRTWRIDWNRDGTTDFSRAYGAANVDIPAPADYNGDGRTDLGVFRPSDRTWRIDWNRDGTTDFSRAYGAANNVDIPAPADYNGDGKADLGVYRPSDRTWRIDWNRDGTTDFARIYGATTNIDIPSPADYNGDGKADLAMYRRTDHIWRIDWNRDGTTDFTRAYGGSSDVPGC